MLNFSKTKIFLIYFTFIILSIFTFLNFIDQNKKPIDKTINLGLDLQGGSYLLLEIDTSLLEQKSLQSKLIPLKKLLKKENIDFTNFSINEKAISFDINQNNVNKFGL